MITQPIDQFIDHVFCKHLEKMDNKRDSYSYAIEEKKRLKQQIEDIEEAHHEQKNNLVKYVLQQISEDNIKNIARTRERDSKYRIDFVNFEGLTLTIKKDLFIAGSKTPAPTTWVYIQHNPNTDDYFHFANTKVHKYYTIERYVNHLDSMDKYLKNTINQAIEKKIEPIIKSKLRLWMKYLKEHEPKNVERYSSCESSPYSIYNNIIANIRFVEKQRETNIHLQLNREYVEKHKYSNKGGSIYVMENGEPVFAYETTREKCQFARFLAGKNCKKYFKKQD